MKMEPGTKKDRKSFFLFIFSCALVYFPSYGFRYYDRECAEDAMRYVNGTRLDDRVIRTDWDAGFKEGRQYGRGKAGGQVGF